MAKYAISTHNYIGSGPTIVAKEGEAEIPAVIISQLDRNSPLDSTAIARNLVTMFNGNKPNETSPFSGRSIQYQGLPSAVVLRFRDENGGVSAQGLQITVNQSAPDAIVAELEGMIDADFMNTLCGASPAIVPSSPAPSTQQHLSR
jgi:hypothetical protein